MKYQGPCYHLHGHNYTLFVTVAGAVNKESGMVMDFHQLEQLVQTEVLSVVDHRYLNDFIETPTAEEISLFIWKKLKPKLPELEEIKLYEMPGYFVTLTAKDMEQYHT